MVLLNVSVLHIVAEETECVEQFVLGQLGRLLKLVGEEGLSVVLNDFEGSVFEYFDQLTCQLHHLASDIRDFSQVLLYLFDVFFVDLVIFLFVFNHFLGSHAESSDQVECSFNYRPQLLNLLVRKEISLNLVCFIKSFKRFSEHFNVEFYNFFIHLVESGCNLLQVGWVSLLEELDVEWFADCNEHVFESLKSKLPDCMGVSVGHV